MKTILVQTNTFFEKIPDTVKRHRLKIWIAFILVTAVLCAGVGRIKIDTSMIAFFKENAGEKLTYDKFRAAFGGDEILYIVYEAIDGDVFSYNSLKAVQDIQEELINYRMGLKEGDTSPLDHITDVTTLVNAQYLESKDGALISRDFIGHDLPRGEKTRDHLKRLALDQPDFPKVLFSPDFRFGGIIIETDYNAIPEEVGFMEPASDHCLDAEEPDAISTLPMDQPNETTPKFKQTMMDEYVPFMQEIEKILEKPEYKDRLRFHPVGTPAFMNFAKTMVLDEMRLIALGTLLMIILTTWMLFRSLSAVVWLLTIVVSSLACLLGTIGWSGVVMPDLLIIIIFFVLAVGVSDSLHILSGYLFFRRQNMEHGAAIRAVYKKSGLACFLTSLTTSVGFLSMLFVPIAAMQKIGFFAAVGVFYAFLLSILLLPLMLDIWSPVSKKRAQSSHGGKIERYPVQRFLGKTENITFQYSGRILLLFLAIGILLLYGASKIRIETSTIEIIREGLPIRKDFKLADRFMAGTDNLEILIDTGQIDGLKDPKVLNTIESLQKHVEQRFPDTITSTFSIADIAKDAFRALNDEAPDTYRIPQDPRILSQTLFLFDNANPDDRRQLITDDYRTARVTIRAKTLNTKNSMELMDHIESFLKIEAEGLRQDYPNLKISTTGQVALRMKLFEYFGSSQIISFGVTLGVICVLLLFVLGSIKNGLMAILPNLVPVAAATGVMGFAGIPLEIHTLMVVPIMIGIAVDDTIHFMTHFQLEMEHHGHTRRAVAHAFREAGQAIVFTSLVLSTGFLLFLFSKNQGFVYYGTLNALSIIMAVIADLVLLPAIIFTISRNKVHRTSFRSGNIEKG